MGARQKFYVTTPIYYVNDRPHIGHVYTTTVADIVARFQRLRGREVFFLTGTDEHAAKVVDAAAERGLSAQDWSDRNAAQFQDTFRRLGIGNDDFIRTSEERHKEKVSRYVAQLVESGDVYKGQFEGWYDAGQEEYVPETKAKQQNYISPINGKPLVRKSEENYFFRLSRYEEDLLEHLRRNPTFVIPDARRNELMGRIEEGLNDVPMSRSGGEGWGIPMPGDPDHTIYVWIDALFNYLTAVDTGERRRFWPADLHLIAKDILWFHAAIWPAMLMALQRVEGNAWISLPRCVCAHSFWISEGRKMSKSLGNFVDLERLDGYVERFGLDALRWFLAGSGPIGTGDRDFADARFLEVYNNELANVVGNSASRVAAMVGRYCEGLLPAPGPEVQGTDELQKSVLSCLDRYEEAMPAVRLDTATAAALEAFRAVDLYIDRTQPFKKAKAEETRPEVQTILYACAEAIRIGSLMLSPVMPGRMSELWTRFGWAHPDRRPDPSEDAFATWRPWGLSRPGTPISKGDPLFARQD